MLALDNTDKKQTKRSCQKKVPRKKRKFRNHSPETLRREIVFRFSGNGGKRSGTVLQPFPKQRLASGW